MGLEVEGVLTGVERLDQSAPGDWVLPSDAEDVVRTAVSAPARADLNSGNRIGRRHATSLPPPVGARERLPRAGAGAAGAPASTRRTSASGRGARTRFDRRSSHSSIAVARITQVPR